MTRATTLKPLGIVREPNQHGQYPDGAFALASNTVIRRLGILEPVPAFEDYRANPVPAGEIFRRIWPAVEGVFAVGQNGADYALRHVTQSGMNAITFPEVPDPTFSPGRTHMAAHRGRYYFTSDQGVLSLESESTTEGYLAGFPPPSWIIRWGAPITPGLAVQAGKWARWRALFTRKGADGSYIKIGPPGYSLLANNGAGLTADMPFRVGWGDVTGLGLREGDFLELYRTTADQNSLGTEPGDTYFLAATATITAADITNGYVYVVDRTPDAALGAALYTNSGELGATQIKAAPPYSVDLATHKGHMFYVAPRLAGYLTLRVPGPWGNLQTDVERTSGIGVRALTATFAAGNATVTGVSNVLGLVPGQELARLEVPAAFPDGTTIVSVDSGASTLLMSAPALNSGSFAFSAIDVFELNGQLITVQDPSALATGVDPSNPAIVIPTDSIWDINTGLPPSTQTGVAFVISSPRYQSDAPEVRATNGQNYDPDVPSLSEDAKRGSQDERLNRLVWSQLDQPEAVPPTNELIVGSAEIYRIIATLDALYIWCSDGLYRLSGFDPDWRIDPVDPTLVLSARNAVDAMRQTIWAGTNRGLVAVSDGSGVQDASTGLLELGRVFQDDTWQRWLTCDESNDEAWYVEADPLEDGFATVFNTRSKAFTEVFFATMNSEDPELVTASTYVPALPGMVFGNDNPAGADLRMFDEDLRAEGVQLLHQPFHGDDSPFTSKNWVDCTWLMRVPVQPLGLLPRMNGQDFPPEVVVRVRPIVDLQDTRGVSAISRNAAFSAALEVGWTPVENVTQPWEFRGLSLRFRIATEQGPTR